MGNMALWGALGGLGKGISQYGGHVMGEASRDADAKRQARLDALRSQQRQALQDDQQDFAAGEAQLQREALERARNIARQNQVEDRDLAHERGETAAATGRGHDMDMVDARADASIRVAQETAPPAAMGEEEMAPPAPGASVRPRGDRLVLDDTTETIKDRLGFETTSPVQTVDVLDTATTLYQEGNLAYSPIKEDARALAKKRWDMKVTRNGETMTRRQHAIKAAKAIDNTAELLSLMSDMLEENDSIPRPVLVHFNQLDQ